MSILDCEIFQQDGVPVHTARIVIKWLLDKEIDLLDWPGNNPDLNVIENCWTVVKQKVAARNPVSMDGFIKKLKEVWETDITEEYCENLAK